MTGTTPPVGGLNQHGLRNHNERVVLTFIQRQGAMPGSEIARRSGLSPQTVSVILRKLENDGLIERGVPVRGRVGKPSVPMALAKSGVLSLGLKIGRRSAELGLMNFHGEIEKVLTSRYRYPVPETIFSFLEQGIGEITKDLPEGAEQKIVGLGIATPFELWNWHELIGAPKAEMEPWRNVDFVEQFSKYSDLPVFLQNDATAACRAECVYGRGRELANYAYFFVGAFVGGGIVLNNAVYEGRFGNAGAFGPLLVHGHDGPVPLMERASIYVLEDALDQERGVPKLSPHRIEDWEAETEIVQAWMHDAATALAEAAQTICAVIDFEAILIDGAFPPQIRDHLAQFTATALQARDLRGLRVPQIGPGAVGSNARVLGAACAPVFSQYLLDSRSNLGPSEINLAGIRKSATQTP